MERIQSARSLEELDRAVSAVVDAYPFLEEPEPTYEELLLIARRNNLHEAEALMQAAVTRWWLLQAELD